MADGLEVAGEVLRDRHARRCADRETDRRILGSSTCVKD